MSDRQDIAGVLHAYTHALDTKDWEAARAVFAPDAVVDYTAAGGPKGSVDEFIAWVSGVMSPFVMSQHFVSNLRITVDGDTAASHAYVYSPLGMDDGRGGLSLLYSGGFYEDRWRRDPEGWRIVERVDDLRWVSDFSAGRRDLRS